MFASKNPQTKVKQATIVPYSPHEIGKNPPFLGQVLQFCLAYGADPHRDTEGVLPTEAAAATGALQALALLLRIGAVPGHGGTGGTHKSSICRWFFSFIKPPFWGTPILGNLHQWDARILTNFFLRLYLMRSIFVD